MPVLLLRIRVLYMVGVAQLVRASDCGSEGRGFEPHLAPFLFLPGTHVPGIFLMFSPPVGFVALLLFH